MVRGEVSSLNLEDWKKKVEDRPGFETATREKMLLSQETRLGVEITGK